MIGSALRKFAQAEGLKVAHGVVYGAYQGYCVTMWDGSGTKTAVFSTRFPEENDRHAFQEKMAQLTNELNKDYRVAGLNIYEDAIHVIFVDTIGTMKRIEAFMPWFASQLAQTTASKVDVCTRCGMQLMDGKWKLVNGIAMYVHEACGQKLDEELQQDAAEVRKEGSYLSGTVGAFVGATIGAVVWALVMLAGYVSALIGLLIGFLAEKGYSLARGKKGPAKIVILILAVIFGVVLGNLGSELIALFQELADYGYSLTFREGVEFMFQLIAEEPEVRAQVIKNVALGLFFAALGVIGLIARTKKEVSLPKIIDLP